MSVEEFLAEALSARTTANEHGLSFGEPAVEPILYRMDWRSPSDVAKDGGIFPNPAKESGTMVDHSKKESFGTNRFVSFSHEHTPYIGRWALRFISDWGLAEDGASPIPEYIFYRGKLNAKKMTEGDWNRLRTKTWYVHKTSADQLPQFVVYTLYEYRVKNILGVRVSGEVSSRENEVLARGATLDDGIEVRPVYIKVPLTYNQVRPLPPYPAEWNMLSPTDSRTLEKLKWTKDSVEFGEWRFLRR